MSNKINSSVFKSPGIYVREVDEDIWTVEDEKRRQHLQRLKIYQRRADIAKKLLAESQEKISKENE